MKKLFVFITALIVSTTSFAEDEFDPSQVKIESFKYLGNGCPANTVAWDLSEDGHAMTLLFDEFMVELPEVDHRRRAKRYCRLKMKMTAPAGWAYTLFYLDLSGFASLEEGSTGVQNTTYWFARGRKAPVHLGKLVLKGPYEDDYERVDDLELRSLPWSSCKTKKQTLVINASIKLRGKPGATAFMTVDSIDQQMTQSYGIAWKRCSQNDKPHYTASCKTIITNNRGRVIKQIIAQGRGKNDRIALNRARQKVEAKCLKRIRRMGRGHCQLQTSVECKASKT